MRTNRILTALAAASSIALALSACGGGSSQSGASASESESDGTLVVGASPSPHAKILKFVQDNLAEKAGLKLDIKEYTDYIQPNVALNDGSLDANYFQTVPYLENQEKESGYDFTAGTGIHLEPLGIFSEKIKDLKDFPDGGTIGIISDVTNQSRALALLAKEGFVELPEGDADANVNTVKKLKNFEFKEVEGAQLVRSLADVDIAAINGNFAQEGGLSLANDAIATESPENNPAVNVLVWKSDVSGAKLEEIKKLDELLHSTEVKDYIEKTWSDGSVIPAF